MVVMAREAWTDERLDDLKSTVDEGFKDMRAEFRAMRAEIAEGRRSADRMAAGIWATNVVGFLGVIATVITQG